MATRTKTFERNAVVGIFQNAEHARNAVDELHRAGFADNQIGVISHGDGDFDRNRLDDDRGSYAEEGALTGALAGAGVGTAWALGIAAGMLPAIGPVIAGGTLAAILASAGVGAAAGGVGGALIGMGIPEDEASYYESEFKSGRTIVTVRANDRYSDAAAIIRRHGGHTQERTGEFQRASFTDMPRTAHATSHTNDQAACETACKTETKRAADTQRLGDADRMPTATRTASTGHDKVQLREEELHVRKQPVETGEVAIHKEVVTEHKTVEVPVQREEVVIERHPVAGHQAAAGSIHENEEIRIPVKEEHVRVEKTPVVKEEISVGKRTIQETETVSEDVRKEKARIERKGDVHVRDDQRPRNS
jgi:uncharacterized protein (TIGR02271 family)